MRATVARYFLALRDALRIHPRIRSLLRRCAICRLFFLVDPRAAWHTCVCCPYGCRPIRQRELSDKRVKAYYQSDSGRVKKAALNEARSPKGASLADPEPAVPADDTEPSPAVVTHLKVIISLLDGRPVSRQEILALLARNLRQRKIGRRPPRRYVRPRSRMKSRGG